MNNTLVSDYCFKHLQCEYDDRIEQFINKIENLLNAKKINSYILDRLLNDKEKYDYDGCIIVLSPKHKIIFLDCKNDKEKFEIFIDDILQNIDHLSTKFDYKPLIGRKREWNNENIVYKSSIEEFVDDLEFNMRSTGPNGTTVDGLETEKTKLLISLFINNPNDTKNIKTLEADNNLTRIKNKIQLFDCKQLNIIHENKEQKQIVIQGLSGTGKTELLFHKLKDTYLASTECKIAFTCYSNVLANHLKTRIRNFFDCMRVEKQIDDEKLKILKAWGSITYEEGVYSAICKHYEIPFQAWSKNITFDKVCKNALESLSTKNIESYLFDYIFIDESQDFPKSFFELCSKVTKEKIYIAGDIFQNIFDTEINTDEIDFSLNRCYRTDARTLMFGHAIGMGLFEDKKINWLEEKQWEQCGYKYNCKENDIIELTREPLKRIAGIDQEQSIFLETSKDLKDSIVKIILNLKDTYKDLEAHDICIIFNDNSMYNFVPFLEEEIYSKTKFECNRAYETKQMKNNKVFITNQNNVKGLEFPFVICVAQDIINNKNISFRNALYMSITRSFLQTYLLLDSEYEDVDNIKKGLDNINKQYKIITKKPTKEEYIEIANNIKSFKEKLSSTFDEEVDKIFAKLKYTGEARRKAKKAIEELNFYKEKDLLKTEEYLKSNKQYYE